MKNDWTEKIEKLEKENTELRKKYKEIMDTDFLHGFNLTVESEREELSNMIDDLLEIEKKNNINQALVTKFSEEGDEYQKNLDEIDLSAMQIQTLLCRIRTKI